MAEDKQSPSAAAEEAVRSTVLAFYSAFNSHDFDRVRAFVTEDWVHINPLGGWTSGRDAILAELREVHSTFLKGVSDTPEEIAVQFASPRVAVVVVPSALTSFSTPDGVRFENPRAIRTFVVAERDGVWRITHDQNTLRR